MNVVVNHGGHKGHGGARRIGPKGQPQDNLVVDVCPDSRPRASVISVTPVVQAAGLEIQVPHVSLMATSRRSAYLHVSLNHGGHRDHGGRRRAHRSGGQPQDNPVVDVCSDSRPRASVISVTPWFKKPVMKFRCRAHHRNGLTDWGEPRSPCVVSSSHVPPRVLPLSPDPP